MFFPHDCPLLRCDRELVMYVIEKLHSLINPQGFAKLQVTSPKVLSGLTRVPPPHGMMGL